MSRRKSSTLFALQMAMCALLLAACGVEPSSNSTPSAPTPPAERAPAAPAAPSGAQAQAGTTIVTRADGSAAWTLRLDGNHVELAGPDGARLIGELRGDKRRYRRESDGAAIAEVKFSDGGFKLRTPESQLLWKVKFGDDKIKVSNNEENQNPWVLKTGYSDKAKVLNPVEMEVGEVRFKEERIKVRNAAGSDEYLIDTTRRSAAFGVLQMSELSPQHQGIIMVELLASGR